jgi:hypothetical protein
VVLMAGGPAVVPPGRYQPTRVVMLRKRTANNPQDVVGVGLLWRNMLLECSACIARSAAMRIHA